MDIIDVILTLYMRTLRLREAKWLLVQISGLLSNDFAQRLLYATALVATLRGSHLLVEQKNVYP